MSTEDRTPINFAVGTVDFIASLSRVVETLVDDVAVDEDDSYPERVGRLSLATWDTPAATMAAGVLAPSDSAVSAVDSIAALSSVEDSFDDDADVGQDYCNSARIGQHSEFSTQSAPVVLSPEENEIILYSMELARRRRYSNLPVDESSPVYEGSVIGKAAAEAALASLEHSLKRKHEEPENISGDSEDKSPSKEGPMLRRSKRQCGKPPSTAALVGTGKASTLSQFSPAKLPAACVAPNATLIPDLAVSVTAEATNDTVLSQTGTDNKTDPVRAPDASSESTVNTPSTASLSSDEATIHLGHKTLIILQETFRPIPGARVKNTDVNYLRKERFVDSQSFKDATAPISKMEIKCSVCDEVVWKGSKQNRRKLGMDKWASHRMKCEKIAKILVAEEKAKAKAS